MWLPTMCFPKGHPRGLIQGNNGSSMLMTLQGTAWCLCPGVLAVISGAPELWPNLEGQVLPSPSIRVAQSDRPQPSVWKDHVRDGLSPSGSALRSGEEAGGSGDGGAWGEEGAATRPPKAGLHRT